MNALQLAFLLAEDIESRLYERCILGVGEERLRAGPVDDLDCGERHVGGRG